MMLKNNRCAYQQNAFAAYAGGGEMRGPTNTNVGVFESVVCPKPRRIGILNPSSINDHIRPTSRLPFSHQAENSDSKAGMELLDLFLTKGSSLVASSPPFFSGSPPTRASNPVIQDAQFGNNSRPSPFSPAQPTSPSSSSGPRTGGACARMKFGQKPAAVRVEGFDCLSRDRQNCSISAFA